MRKREKWLLGWKGELESTIKTVRSKEGWIRTKHYVVEAKAREKGALVLTSRARASLEALCAGGLIA